MRRLSNQSGFSLMEMMIVLAIVAIVAAASAPMLNKKMVHNASGESPWVWVGNSKSIAYNYNDADNNIASIGKLAPNDVKSRLYIDSNNSNPFITFGRDGKKLLHLSSSADDTITLSERLAGDSIKKSVGIGYGSDISAGAVAVGYQALAKEGGSVAIGRNARASRNCSIAIGLHPTVDLSGNIKASEDNAPAGNPDDDKKFDGDANGGIAIGYYPIVTASQGMAIGNDARAGAQSAMALSTSSRAIGKGSVAVGCGAGASVDGAIALGWGAQASATSKTQGYGDKEEVVHASIAIGHGAKALDSDALAIGRSTQASGESAIAIGSHSGQAGGYRNTTASGARAIAIGDGAVAAHEKSVAIGEWATTTKSNQIMLGTSSEEVHIPGNLVVDGTLSISNLTIPGNLVVEGDARLGGANHPVWMYATSDAADGGYYFTPDRIDGNGPWGTLMGRKSDRRLKNVGEAFKGGLAEIKKLEAFHYTFKDDKNKTPRVGVMAQDLKKIFPDAVIKGEDGFLRIRMEDMFYALVNAVKELDLRINAHDKKIAELEKQNQELIKQNQALQDQNKAILKRLEALEKLK